MIFLSAGHTPTGPNTDPGAVSGTVREADLTKELRNLTLVELSKLGVHPITDDDRESLAQYLRRIKPGTGSVLCEIHFNGAANDRATGTEVVIPASGGTAKEREMERKLGEQIAAVINKHTGIVRRGKNGVITEAETARKSLAFMRPAGINVLIEVCFITNPSDLQRYRRAKEAIARDLAALLVEADGWV